MKYQGIVFDFNGVLLWDSHLHEQAWLLISRELRGFPFTQEELDNHMHGKPNRYIFEYLLQHEVPKEKLQKLCQRKEALYRDLCLQNLQDFQLSPGAVDLLNYLVENQIPHTIATFAPKDNLDFYLAHLKLSNWFEIEKVVYDDGTFPGKAEMYKKAATHLQLAPEQCIAIEDSIFGIKGAVQANMGKVIGLGPKEAHPVLLRLQGVSQVITDFTQFERTFFEQVRLQTLQPPIS